MSRLSLAEQNKQAKVLRAQASAWLLSSDTPVATGFREGKAAIGEDYRAFIKAQSQDKVWATDIEAAALGEIHGVNVRVTTLTKTQDGVTEAKHSIYETKREEAPTVQLYNLHRYDPERGSFSGEHWCVDPKAPWGTISNGNCLYGAFAQAQAALENKSTFEQAVVIEHQKEIEASFRGKLHSSEAVTSDEVTRTREITPEEHKQIQEDFELALQLAQEEKQASESSEPPVDSPSFK